MALIQLKKNEIEPNCRCYGIERTLRLLHRTKNVFTVLQLEFRISETLTTSLCTLCFIHQDFNQPPICIVFGVCLCNLFANALAIASCRLKCELSNL